MSLMMSPGVRGPVDLAGVCAAAGCSAGRGRGAVAFSATAAGFAGASALLNIGAGCVPFCMNSTLVRIATAPKATTVKPTASRGLQPSACSRRGPRSASTAAPFPPPVPPARLRTFPRLVVGLLIGAARHEPLDRDSLAAAFRAVDRQMEGDARAFAEPARNVDLAAVQRQKPLDDRHAKPGAVMAAIVARARLEERIADPGQILGADADAIVL